ncbi:unnamed protein product [Adineta ricciae]|uniref:Uncharacterized protein n=1 Tax=Adineta ricciae TaxID=249248 RepID=A0A815X414_ADIRI|nr:unnamed protein product [Adineta ricciae]CAF1550618.1 unnamed protein product [Adineta ricciae]
MARKYEDIEREIRRIEGQLLVAKQICRENLKEINHLKKQQENDSILEQTNHLLSLKSLNSRQQADQFNDLLRLVYEQQANSLEKTIQAEEKNADENALLVDLSSNITELESLFDYAKTLLTQPVTSIHMLNNTLPLHDITTDLSTTRRLSTNSIQITDLQQRVDLMHQRLTNLDQCDDCLIHFFYLCAFSMSDYQNIDWQKSMTFAFTSGGLFGYLLRSIRPIAIFTSVAAGAALGSLVTYRYLDTEQRLLPDMNDVQANQPGHFEYFQE